MGQKGSLDIHSYQKYPKSVKIWLSYGHFPTERLGDSFENHIGQRGTLGIDLYQKYAKLVKKWPSYGYFPIERLRDFIEDQVGQQGILGCSFVPKSSNIGQEMAELWPFLQKLVKR